MRNTDFADVFMEIADLLEIQQENVFKIRAYRRAAEQLTSLGEDVVLALQSGKKIPGIGADLSAKIREGAETGSVAYLEELRRVVPLGVRQMIALPGIGPKSARLLHEKLAVDSIEALEAHCRSGKILEVPGFQKKSAENILRGIETWRSGQNRMPLGKALGIAEALVAALREHASAASIAIVGSLRRRVDMVGDIDILAATSRPGDLMDRFATLPQIRAILARGETRVAARHRENIQVDLRLVEPRDFGAALHYFTGSKGHNVRLGEIASLKQLEVNEHGVFDAKGSRIAGDTEEDVYSALGLPWIAPELREDAGEIEAALAGRLPSLVELGDIRGDLHAHTDWTDGRLSMEDLVAAAEARGYEYIIVSDHSRSTTIARGLAPEQVRQQILKVRELQPRRRIRILTGSECDILADGTLDLPDDLLAELDVVLAAVHSRFKQPRAEMTARICRALENPHVRILVHPTGRLLGSRDPYDVDLEAVFEAAGRHGKAVEINSSLYRLDLKDVHARRARDLGLRVSIATDTHALAELGSIALGIATARRAWIGPTTVVNAMPLARLLDWAHAGRG